MKEFWPAVEKRWRQLGAEKKFINDLQAMRERIATERIPKGEEERAYKTRRGGLIDVEFAAQAWQMRQGMAESETAGVLKKMAKAQVPEARALQEGLGFWSAAEWWLRLDEGRGGSLLPPPGPDREWLAKKCGAGDGVSFMKVIAETARTVRQAYDGVTGRLGSD
jgi:glutamate-ammonia-ligase adenylyltransferase